MTVIIISLVAVIALVTLIVVYNILVGKRQMVRNGWADIDVQLKRRANLIPSLVETVKGYAAHERQLFAEVTEKPDSRSTPRTRSRPTATGWVSCRAI